MAERGRPRCFEREDALRKAMNVFWCKGFEGASLSELTTAMGINSPSLYAAFGSKETLFLEAVELYRQTDGAATRQAFDAGTTAKEAIAGLLETSSSCITHKKHNDSVQSHDSEAKSDSVQPTGCMVVLSALHCSNENQKVQEQLSSKRRETEVLIHERLLRGVQDGEISSQANIADIARFYVTILHGMSIQARDGACQDILLTIAKQAMLAWDSLTLANSHEKKEVGQVAELI